MRPYLVITPQPGQPRQRSQDSGVEQSQSIWGELRLLMEPSQTDEQTNDQATCTARQVGVGYCRDLLEDREVSPAHHQGPHLTRKLPDHPVTHN